MKLQAVILLSAFALVGLLMSCANNSEEDPVPDQTPNPTVSLEGEVWGGSRVTFSKADGANPSSESNQDRITDKVWITRGNGGGQIYNIRSESNSSKSSSPSGTLWAIGTTDEVQSLTFGPFRSTIRPKSVIGRDLVLYLVEDEVFIDIRFLSWSENKRGGFSYERSTED